MKLNNSINKVNRYEEFCRNRENVILSGTYSYLITYYYNREFSNIKNRYYIKHALDPEVLKS